jgi:hypothetical protein
VSSGQPAPARGEGSLVSRPGSLMAGGTAGPAVPQAPASQAAGSSPGVSSCVPRGYRNPLPPSMAMTWPVTQPDFSEAKKLTPLAMSAGWPSLPIAIPASSARCPSGP